MCKISINRQIFSESGIILFDDGFNFRTFFEAATCACLNIELYLDFECETWQMKMIYELEKVLLNCEYDISRVTKLMALSIVLFYRSLWLPKF